VKRKEGQFFTLVTEPSFDLLWTYERYQRSCVSGPVSPLLDCWRWIAIEVSM
jgi:hypothetical protein